ncbi:MAG: flagellar hook basal-body protein [Planctomycetes bacterium]|nr:flagellar hook basal-body protein [Planctomycetota bacterium]
MSTFGLEISRRGALAQSARLEIIAHNLANAATVGFRREMIGFRANLQAAIATDPRPGDLDVTRRPLDLAILGPGYFTVRDLETGADCYTRAGNFSIDSSGRLVTADGRCQAVASDGREIALDPAAQGSLRVGEDGTLFQGEVGYGQLGVVEFEDVARLARRGDNLVENRGSALGGAPGSRIQQGTLERSSVDPVLESAEMVRALRALEANLQMLRIQDATLERTVNELARPAK